MKKSIELPMAESRIAPFKRVCEPGADFPKSLYGFRELIFFYLTVGIGIACFSLICLSIVLEIPGGVASGVHSFSMRYNIR